jgi:hypothetical protein
VARYSPRYLDALLDSAAYDSLVELQGLLLRVPDYDVSQPARGLCPPFFVVVETLQWFAQGSRSGVWTYFEATPPQRQQAMTDALQKLGAHELARRYHYGIAQWRDPAAIAELDVWMRAQDEVAHQWLRALLRTHRAELKALLT